MASTTRNLTFHSIRSDPQFSKMDERMDSVCVRNFRQLSKSDIFIRGFSKTNQLKSDFRWLIFEKYSNINDYKLNFLPTELRTSSSSEYTSENSMQNSPLSPHTTKHNKQ